LQSGDERARDKVIQTAMGYVRLLRQHIYKEDHILFPMADKVIPLDRQQQLYEAFRQSEVDEMGELLSEKFHALAQRLMDESIR
jgi:hemerythrin-like domain-containing protein